MPLQHHRRELSQSHRTAQVLSLRYQRIAHGALLDRSLHQPNVRGQREAATSLPKIKRIEANIGMQTPEANLVAELDRLHQMHLGPKVGRVLTDRLALRMLAEIPNLRLGRGHAARTRGGSQMQGTWTSFQKLPQDLRIDIARGVLVPTAEELL